MLDNQITLINDEGVEELANILFTHTENGKNYIVFEFVESGDVSAAIYIEESETEGRLVDIETDEEWAMLDELLDEYFADEDEEELED